MVSSKLKGDQPIRSAMRVSKTVTQMDIGSEMVDPLCLHLGYELVGGPRHFDTVEPALLTELQEMKEARRGPQWW
jgi:hypothetical protein